MVRARLSALVTVALLLAVVSSVLSVSGTDSLRAVFTVLLLPSIAVVCVFLAAGIALASLRLKFISADLGYSLSLRDAAITLSLSQIAGTFFFQIAGQLMARGAMLSQRGIPAAATVVISGYERAVASAVSLVLAACGALYLFGTLSFDLDTGGYMLIKIIGGLTAAAVAGALFAWGPVLRRHLGAITRVSLLRLLRSVAISAAIQISTLAAYLAIQLALAPDISILALAAASCVVMLAASLPVSLGGWGFREMSAVVALQTIGLSSAAALMVAVLIGLMSLVMLAALAVTLTLSAPRRASTPPAVNAAGPAIDYTALLDWTLPLIAATAVFFQIHLPVASGLLNVNLADPIAITAAALFVIRQARARCWPQWRLAGLNLHLALATLVMLTAFFHGWIAAGWSDWAFSNKTLGWFVLLAYGATGAVLVRRAGDAGLQALLATFVAAGAAVAVLDLGALAFFNAGASTMRNFIGEQLSGFSQNPNAFGFALLMTVAAALCARLDGRLRTGFVALALAAIWFSGSRSAIGTAPLLLAAAWFTGVPLRTIAQPAAAGTAVVLAIMGIPYLCDFILGGGFVRPLFPALRDTSGSDYEHLRTVQEAFAMFLAHPAFGAGLGAFTKHYFAETGTALVVHSTPAWLLAETGLAGFAVFAAAAWRIVRGELARLADPAARLIVLTLFAFAVMSSVHELLYQRALWLLLGAALAAPLAVKPLKNRAETASGAALAEPRTAG